MCNPALAVMAIAAAGAAMEHKASVEEAEATNAAHAQTRQNAKDAAQFKYQQETRDYIEDTDKINEASFDSFIETEGEVATATAALGGSGVDGLSPAAMIADIKQTGARKQNRLDKERSNRNLDLMAGLDAAHIEAKNRINNARDVKVPTSTEGMLSIGMSAGSAYFGAA